MRTIHFDENIPVKGEYDVIVAGGGVSGAAAALAAARGGKSVLLIEKQCSLGGLSTCGLVNFWVPLCNGRGKMIIHGMAEEFLKLSLELGFDSLPPDWKNGEPEKETEQRCVSRFSAGLFSLQLLRLLVDAGVEILYDALVSTPITENGRCLGLVIDGKSGRMFYRGKIIVDATGDAQILKQAGVPTVDGENYFTYYAEGITLDGCRRAAESGNPNDAYSSFFGGPADLYGNRQPKDKPTYKGVSLELINEYLRENQLELLRKEKSKDRMSRAIHMLPGMPQLRTSRRIDGNRTLTEADCYRHTPDSIGAICDFDRRDSLYEIPYGTLVRDGFPNLITCGRSASADGWGWDVLRVIPPAIITGQCAGIAASHAIDENLPVSDISITSLQKSLEEGNVDIHFDDSLVPDDKKSQTAPTGGHI